MNKQDKRILNNYMNSEYYSLSQKYNTCSYAKMQAEYEILQDMRKLGGYDYKIISGNSHMFSCAFTFEENGKKFLKYFTRTKTQVFEIE